MSIGKTISKDCFTRHSVLTTLGRSKQITPAPQCSQPIGPVSKEQTSWQRSGHKGP